jgi:hypothetical protein
MARSKPKDEETKQRIDEDGEYIVEEELKIFPQR